MGAVTFLSPVLRDKIKIAVPSGVQATLLHLAKELKIPLRCHCELGGCGKCAVKVVPLHAQHETGMVRLGEKEKDILFRAGKLSRQQYESDVLQDMPPLWRLACQYLIRDEEILVAF